MSLTKFVTRPEVVALVKSLRPKGPRKIEAQMRAGPLGYRHMLVGNAFDYLLRFEIKRRAPNSIERRWIADDAALMVSTIPRRLQAGDLRESGDFDTDRAAEMVDEIVGAARLAVDAYRRNSAPSPHELHGLALHAIQLAKLDMFVRSGRLSAGFAELDDTSVDDARDILAMLDIVPYAELLGEGQVFLNPAFGVASNAVRGADTDLVCGDMLVDIKATIKSELSAAYLDQLLGYFLLSRECRRADASFPVIERVGIYFARHGYLWTMPVTTWTAHRDFSMIEEQFFKLARAPYVRPQSTSAATPEERVGDTDGSIAIAANRHPRPRDKQRTEASARQEAAFVAAERRSEERAKRAAERAETVVHWSRGCRVTSGLRASATAEVLAAERKCPDCVRVIRARRAARS